jgi:hypothetical protein
MSCGAALKYTSFEWTGADYLALALSSLCVAGAVAVYSTVTYSDKYGTAPTFEEQQEQKRKLREYVEGIRVDYGIYKTKTQVYTERDKVEGHRLTIMEDIERVYDAAVRDGTFLYRCNSSEVFVAIPREYLYEKHNIQIDSATYIFNYCRSFLPDRVRVDRQYGIPGVDPRGFRVWNHGVWDTDFARTYIEYPEHDDILLGLGLRCQELFELLRDAQGTYQAKPLIFNTYAPSDDFFRFFIRRPELLADLRLEVELKLSPRMFGPMR